MKLIDRVLSEINDEPNDDIQIGSTFVGVKIGSRIGVAHRVDDGEKYFGMVENYRGLKVAELIYSDDPLEAAIGTAAINAQLKPKNVKHYNVFEKILEFAPKYSRIGIVGKFPIIDQLKEQGCDIYAFEKKELPGFLPADMTSELLPKCDLSIITGTAFVNKTLEPLLELSNGYTMVIGPTTPLSTALFDFGVDVLAGIIAKDDGVLDVITKGGGTREFKKFVEKIYIEG